MQSGKCNCVIRLSGYGAAVKFDQWMKGQWGDTVMSVLIVEDDLSIADCLEEVLIDAGFGVCGIACTVADAVELATSHDPGLGVIDVNLGAGRTGTEIAAALRRRGPFGVLYVTGNPEHPALAAAEGEGCLTKPYSMRGIVAALGIVGALVAGRPVSSAFPRGFRRIGAAYPPPACTPA